MKSKRELEDEKKKADEAAAAKAYEDFVATFVDVPAQKGKVWVKAGTFDAGSRREDTKDKGKLYKPTSRLAELVDKFSTPEKAAQNASHHRSSSESKSKKKEKEKKKSNLELFKEELKMIQEERAERHRIKSMYHRDSGKSTRFEAPEVKQSSAVMEANLGEENAKSGSFDSGDPTTTNLYLGNLSPKITEQRLMELFGRYGPLASIKIMWPRTDDERSRGRNCGFVAFMNRRDGERALNALNGRDIDGFEMKLGWGKSVPIPLHPIYIPPSLMGLTLPPPPSGLPFNAQPNRRDLDEIPPMGLPAPKDPDQIKRMEQILQRAVVKVVIPTERSLLHLIHRTIEFVVREGPMFEAMVMNKEITSPDFRFLFENQSPAHVYYRWKLFSILQGDSQNKWRTKPFRMFKNGSIWKPPPLNPFLQGMPEELLKQEQEFDDRNKKGSLSNSQRNRLESMIRQLIPERDKIGEVMVWCIEHADAAEEICQCISESLNNVDTYLPKKIARLHLVSDVLHNCSVKVSNASFYRKGFQAKLGEIFEGLHLTYVSIESRIRAEQFKQRVMQCCRAWEDWAIYPHDFLITMQNIFLGLVKRSAEKELFDCKSESDFICEKPTPRASELDVDGIPMDDVDGFPLAEGEGEGEGGSGGDRGEENTPLIKSSAAISALMGYDDDFEEEEDIDGAPLEEDLDGMPLSEGGSGGVGSKGFATSNWESVSPKRVQSQAMTLSKWDELEGSNKNSAEGEEGAAASGNNDEDDFYNNHSKYEEDDDDIDGIPMVYEEYRRRSQSSEEDSRSQNSESDEELKGEPNEERRARLRAVEVRVMQYQDELEQGQRTLKPGYSVHRQVQHYRHKLLKKISRDEGGSERRSRRHKSRSSSPEEKSSSRHKRSRRRSRSRSSSRRKRSSRSPRKKRSYSRSPPARKHKKKSRH